MTFAWTAPVSSTDLLTTGLNSLAAGSSALSSAITPNSSYTGYLLYADFALNLASFSPAAGSAWQLYILAATDDTPTNYAGIESADPVGTFWTPAGTTVTRYLQVLGVRLPNRPWKAGLLSVTGTTTLAASGNVLRYWPYSEA